jgi:hypothetical protein
MSKKVSDAGGARWPNRKAYDDAVREFLNGKAQALYRAKVEESLASWDFKQCVSETNKEKLSAATAALRAASSDTEALATLCALIGDRRFQKLDRRTRRALAVARLKYEENTAGPGDDPQFLPLRKVVDDTTIELDRIRTVSRDVDNPGANIPEGHDKPFAELLRDLVSERNRLARMRNHPTFYHMLMAEQGQNFDAMQRLVADIKDGIKALTPRLHHVSRNGPKQADVDELLGHITDPALMLQQTAAVMGVDPAVLQAILSATDLYPRAKKDSHWYAFPIDPPVDVRASVNISVPPEKLLAKHVKNQLLHEVFGHGLDFRSINPDLHPLLRDHDRCTAEAVAGLSEDLIYEPRWLKSTCSLTASELRERVPGLQLLELRWVIHILNHNIANVEFEMELYRDPAQDLDAAYAKAKAPVQYKKPSEMEFGVGEWAVDVPHFVAYPCYIHNYIMGDAWTAQVRQTLRKRFGSYASRRTGPFLRRHRRHGLVYTADEQVLRMTGKPLGAEDLLAEFDKLTSTLEKWIEANPKTTGEVK